MNHALVFVQPAPLLPRHIPEGAAALDYVASEEGRDNLRRVRWDARHVAKMRLAGRYVIKGSDAAARAATGCVPSHVRSPATYIVEAAPLRPEPKRKHRSAKAYARRQAKRHPGGTR